MLFSPPMSEMMLLSPAVLFDSRGKGRLPTLPRTIGFNCCKDCGRTSSRQLEVDEDIHLDGHRHPVQVRGLILPRSYRIQRRLVKQDRAGNNLHLDDIAVFIENG